MEHPDKFLPYAKQRLDSSDIDAVTSVLQSDYLTTGPLVEKFERRIGKITKADNVVVCSSGTAALHLASMALGLCLTLPYSCFYYVPFTWSQHAFCPI